MALGKYSSGHIFFKTPGARHISLPLPAVFMPAHARRRGFFLLLSFLSAALLVDSSKFLRGFWYFFTSENCFFAQNFTSIFVDFAKKRGIIKNVERS